MEINRNNHLSQTPAPRPSRAPKTQVDDYEPTAKDIQFREALEDWRTEVFESNFRDEIILGHALVMPDSILNRIVDVVHVGIDKISTAQQLSDETDWIFSLASIHFAEIRAILVSVYGDDADNAQSSAISV